MPKKSLAETHPELAMEWHPTLNGELTPNDFTPGSGKKVWWKCPEGDDHEWISNIANRSRGNGCSICSGKKVVLSNCLGTMKPKLAKEWHPTKNEDLTPYNVTERSGKKVWWKCDKGEDHEWKAVIASRANGRGCSICSGQMVVFSNCLATTHPKLAKEWHPTKNGDLTPYVIISGSDKKVWWKCDKREDHEWVARIYSRAKDRATCPICCRRKFAPSNSFATRYPALAKEWHPTKNGKLTPENTIAGGQDKIWWKCDKGEDHEWQTSIIRRKQGRGCHVCENKKIVLSNCLATTNPELAKEWHPTKNGKLTPYNLTEGSHKKVWWKCDKGDDHEWAAVTGSRNDGRGCPFCTLTPQSKQELTITFELMKLFKNINPKGLKTKLNGKLRAIDIYIPKLNLCIEFDGHYWHKEQEEIDKIKSEMLFDEGFKVIRVREEPLIKTHDNDIISKKPYNGKQVTNDILSMIMSIFELDAKLVSKIKAYQSKEGLQNERGLDRYIDKILTEKAEKE